MREALPVCRAKPNWMPRKPKLILKICAVLSRCFVRLVWVFIGVSWIGCNTIKKMQGMHNLLFPIVPLVCAVVFEKVMRYLQLKELTRSEEHTSELQSLMRISYAVFCLKKK